MQTSKKSRAQSTENPKIPGIGIGIWKSRKIPGINAKSRDFYPRDLGFLTVGIFRGFYIPWIGIFSWDGKPRQKAEYDYETHRIENKKF